MDQPKRIICVSHLTGAQGEEVARSVAERLGFRYLDEEIIETAAEWVDLHPSAVGEVERRKSLLTRIGDSIRGRELPDRPDASVQRRPGGVVREMPADEDMRALIRDAVRHVADDGDVVVAAHAASMVLADREDVFRVLVTASPHTRADRIVGAGELDARQAERLLEKEDAGRADYLRRFHGVEAESPIHYDLVLNTDRLNVEGCANLIVLATTS
jgi:cytidylate kinase